VQPISTEGNRCYSGMKRWARIHITPGVAIGSAEGVVTEVDAIVEAYHKRVRVSGTFRQHGPGCRAQHLNHSFPMIPHLFLISARADTWQIGRQSHVNV